MSRRKAAAATRPVPAATKRPDFRPAGRGASDAKVLEAVRADMARHGFDNKVVSVRSARNGLRYLLVDDWEPSVRWTELRDLADAHGLILDGTDGALWYFANEAAGTMKESRARAR